MGIAIRHRLRPMVYGSLVGLAFVAGLVMIVRDLRLDQAPPSTGTELQARADADADALDAPQTALLLRDATRATRDDVTQAVAPVLQHTESLTHRPGVVAAILRNDTALLRQIANEEIRRSGAVDALAFVDVDGRLLAVNSVDIHGTPFPAARIDLLMKQDVSQRPVVSACLHSDSPVPILEFQTSCDFTRILWDSTGLSVACSAQVIDETTGRCIGLVTTRIRFERIEALIDSEETPGIDLVIVDGTGHALDEHAQRGEVGITIPTTALAGLVGSLEGSEAQCSSVSTSGQMACAFPLSGLRTVKGGNVFVIGVAQPRLIAAEVGHGQLVTAASTAMIVGLAGLSGVLLLQARTQRKASLALVTARNDADAASRSKTEFLANMSHEIRTPMTAIIGFVDLLADHGDGQENAPSRDEAVETIRRNARHLLSLINDVLDLSKIEAGHMRMDRQRVRTLDLVQDALRLMDDRARQKGIALRLVMDGDVPESISTDPTRLRQVLINLLGNAVKFTDQGAVTLTLRRLDDRQDKLAFEVADTGIGMTPEQLSRLYQPFVQADSSTTRRYGGTGLGLAITRRCIDIMGGAISARSAPGSGTTFEFTIDTGDLTGIPAARLRSNETKEGSSVLRLPSAVRQPLSGIRVLLAEDGIDNQRLIRFHLERAGANVEIVDNGAKAVERVQDSSRMNRHDVILMDMQMPVMDGYEAVRRLTTAGERTPIIALTAHAMAGDREKCLESGCHDYLCKPVDVRALISAIRHAIAPGATECTMIRRPDDVTGEILNRLPDQTPPHAAAG